MIRKLLAWAAFSLAMIFVCLGITALVLGGSAAGADTARTLLLIAMPLLAIAVALTLGLLVASAFESDS